MTGAQLGLGSGLRRPRDAHHDARRFDIENIGRACDQPLAQREAAGEIFQRLTRAHQHGIAHAIERDRDRHLPFASG